MSDQLEQLKLQDIRAGIKIDVIDRLRRHGIRGKVILTTVINGVTHVEFIDPESIRYMWCAPSMGLVAGVSSFWKTYLHDQGPDNIKFGSLHSYGSRRE